MIVAQARLPCLYRDYGVADTVNGRFDLIVLHLALVLDRLAQDPSLRELGQAVPIDQGRTAVSSLAFGAAVLRHGFRRVGELKWVDSPANDSLCLHGIAGTCL